MNQLASSGQLRASVLRWALVIVPLVLLLGFLSGRVSQSGPDNVWFAALAKPSLYPPPATFGIVWSILYVLMGVAASLIAAARGASGRALALGLFAVQLLLNLGWSPLFFGIHQISAALYLLIALIVAAVGTLIAFWKVRPVAGMLLLPYCAWLLFASVLNWQILQLNPAADGAQGGAAVTRVQI